MDQFGQPWFLSGIYASIEYSDWRVLWVEITRLMLQGVPSLIVGDFNCIVGPHEMECKRAVNVDGYRTDTNGYEHFGCGVKITE